MKRIQVQGLHHITIVGSTKQSAVDPGSREIGSVDHIAFNVSRASFKEAAARLTERGISFYERDRGFMELLHLKMRMV